jgi:preprotein translocase subunit SecB
MADPDVERDMKMAELANAVTTRVQIIDIRLLESRTEQKPFDFDLAKRMTTSISVQTHVDENLKVMEVFPHFRLLVIRKNDSPEEIFVRIEARFAVSYQLATLENLKKEHYDAFGDRNGVFTVWPYWREFVQSTTVRMGLPPLTLPVFRVGTSKLEQDSLLPPKMVKQIGAANKP